MPEVKIGEVTWNVEVVGRRWSFGSRESAGPKPRKTGLLFTSDRGEKRFLAVTGTEPPSDEDLRGLSADKTYHYLSRATPLSEE